MSILTPNQDFGLYTVDALIKDGGQSETYRVRARSGETLFLKLYDSAAMPREALDADGGVIAIGLVRGLDHDNVIRYIADGVYESEGKKYPYLITNYFSGRLLSELVADRCVDVPTALGIYEGILGALGYLHSKGLVHNDITPRNVMYDPESGRVQLIDLDHMAHAGTRERHYMVADLSPWYRSPENMRGLNETAGDIFSASAVVYALLTGRAPWQKDLPERGEKESPDDYDRRIKTTVHASRKGALDTAGIDRTWLADTLAAALTLKGERPSIHQLLYAIEREEAPAGVRPAEAKPDRKDDKPGCVRQKTAEATAAPAPEPTVKKGNGFDDVAGMDELKDLLRKKVLFILTNRELAEKYRLTPPNGMLLYGPPGCGKTYFAEKFAEESGFNYKFIKASDLGSIYVHGGQGKIAELFDKARQKSPIIICFDEFDAMVPDRTSRSAEHISGEVNEFLSQLNNCSKDGIFVIGTTNRPELIDPAVLRKGRLDISVYIPAPDKQTRKLMFDLYLKDRPVDKIDTEALAEMTDKYVASDIAFIVNDAAMIAAFRNELITQDGLVNSIKTTRPSLNEALLKSYDATRQKLENTSGAEPRPRVGFVQYS